MASGAHPFDTADELAGISAPTLLVPGNDPEHPPEVATLYARYLPNVTVVEPTRSDLPQQLTAFCTRHLSAIR